MPHSPKSSIKDGPNGHVMVNLSLFVFIRLCVHTVCVNFTVCMYVSILCAFIFILWVLLCVIKATYGYIWVLSTHLWVSLIRMNRPFTMGWLALLPWDNLATF